MHGERRGLWFVEKERVCNMEADWDGGWVK